MNANTYIPPLRYPLRIGVTGHRDLRQPDAVAQAVDRVLDEIQEVLVQSSDVSGVAKTIGQRTDELLARCVRPIIRIVAPRVYGSVGLSDEPCQTEIAWTVISPLARGADRVVARAVLAKPDARLEVVSLLPLDEYRRDFTEPDDLEEVNQLLTHDPRPTELNRSFDEDQDARNEAYLSAGRTVVDTCEILLAIWNGKPADGTGGTADVVRYALDRGRTILWIDADDQAKPARLLTTDANAAAFDANAADRPLPGMSNVAMPTRAKDLSLGFHRLAAYNRDSGFDATACQATIARDESELRRVVADAGLPAETLQPIIANLLPHYARADQLAILYQSLYVFAAKWLFRLSALAVTVVVAQVLFFPHALWLILFEIAAMVTTVVLLRISKREAWHEKWLNDRHLAEWLRASVFTAMAGTHLESSKPDPGQALPFYHGPDNWFIDTYDSLLVESRNSIPDALPFTPMKRFLIDGWVAEQARWHRANAARKKRAAHFYHRTGLALFGTTLVMAVLHLFGVGHVEHHNSPAKHEIGGTTVTAGHSADHAGESGSVDTAEAEHIASQIWALSGLLITFLAIVLPAWGGAVYAIGNLLDFERIAARSERMSKVLSTIASRAEDTQTMDALRREVAKAEEVIAAENHEWLVSLSFRGLVLPA